MYHADEIKTEIDARKQSEDDAQEYKGKSWNYLPCDTVEFKERKLDQEFFEILGRRVVQDDLKKSVFREHIKTLRNSKKEIIASPQSSDFLKKKLLELEKKLVSDSVKDEFFNHFFKKDEYSRKTIFDRLDLEDKEINELRQVLTEKKSIADSKIEEFKSLSEQKIKDFLIGRCTVKHTEVQEEGKKQLDDSKIPDKDKGNIKAKLKKEEELYQTNIAKIETASEVKNRKAANNLVQEEQKHIEEQIHQATNRKTTLVDKALSNEAINESFPILFEEPSGDIVVSLFFSEDAVVFHVSGTEGQQEGHQKTRNHSIRIHKFMAEVADFMNKTHIHKQFIVVFEHAWYSQRNLEWVEQVQSALIKSGKAEAGLRFCAEQGGFYKSQKLYLHSLRHSREGEHLNLKPNKNINYMLFLKKKKQEASDSYDYFFSIREVISCAESCQRQKAGVQYYLGHRLMRSLQALVDELSQLACHDKVQFIESEYREFDKEVKKSKADPGLDGVFIGTPPEKSCFHSPIGRDDWCDKISIHKKTHGSHARELAALGVGQPSGAGIVYPGASGSVVSSPSATHTLSSSMLTLSPLSASSLAPTPTPSPFSASSQPPTPLTGVPAPPSISRSSGSLPQSAPPPSVSSPLLTPAGHESE